MLKFLKSKTAKTVGGLMVAAMLFVGASTASAALTTEQVNAILGLLNSFGADATTVANVQASLTGGSPVVTTTTTTTTTSTTCDLGTTTLRVGSKGQYVKNLQTLVGAGADGIFGNMTKAKVMAWQSDHGLTADGIVGPASRAAMCGSGSGTPSTPVVTGTGVSLAMDNPAAGVVIETQAGADLLHLTFSGNYTVTNVVLNRIGISTSSTLSNIYLFDGATRLTEAASVNSMGQISWNQPSGLFAVNGVKTISVRANIADAMAGQTVGLAFGSAMAGTTAIAGSASGNIFSIAANPSTMSTVAFGTVTPTGSTINPANGVTLWQSVATIGNNDVYLDRLALRQVGSAPATAMANFKLYSNGILVAEAAGIDANGYVTFVPASPVLMSSSRILRVDADVVSGASRTIQLSLRTAADVNVRDSQLGVNVTATGIAAVAASANTISGSSGGTLTIVKDVSSNSQNVTLNGTDVSLATFKVSAFGEPIKIETLYAGVNSSDNAVTSLANGRILINGAQYGSTATLNETDTTAAGTGYTLNYTVYPGTPVMLEVRGDLTTSHDSDISSGDTMTVSLIAGSSNATRVDSLGTLSTGAATANTLTIATTSVTLTKDATYTNQTVVLPQTAYKIGDWNLTGSSVEDVLISTLSFDLDEVTNTTLNEDDVTNIYAIVTDGVTTVTTSPTATVAAADNNFSINYTLKKNGSASVELYGTLASGATAADSFKTDLTVTGTSLVSSQSITATSADTDGQTIIAGSGSLTVTADASTPDSTKFADNQTVRSATFKFAAVNTGYKVTDVVLTLPAAGATVVQTVTISSTTGSFTASRAGGATVTFSGLDWNIPANQNALLNVDLALGTVSGTNGGTSGASLLTTLTSATATSASTGTSAAATESDPAGNVHYAYAAVPSITLQTLPTSVLANGTVTLAKFTVNTNGTGTIAWKEVMLDIAKTGGGTDAAGTEPTITSPTLWDADTNTQITAAVLIQNANGTAASTCAESDTTCEIVLTVGTKADDNVEKQIAGSKTYEVRATIGATLATGDYVSATIAKNLSYVANAVFTSADNDTTADDASFVWSDVSAQSHDTGTADWTNEALLVGLPTTSWTLTK